MKKDEVSELIRWRLEQAESVLSDAKFLLEGKRSPLSIVNRSYYAMFYASLALLQKIGKVPSKHAGVIGLFDTEFVLKGVFPKEMSKNLHRAFELRQISDYSAREPVSPEKARETFQNAVNFVEAVTTYLQTDEASSPT
jgi:uncharacterized protein (UPF0332 family)